MRYAMAKVAGKILSGEENNTRKWKYVEDLVPNLQQTSISGCCFLIHTSF